LVTVRKDSEIVDYERIAFASCNEKASYTEMKQLLDYMVRVLGINYSIEEAEHESFISGRVGRVIVNGKKIGFLLQYNSYIGAARLLEIGFALLPSERRKGYCTEATKIIVDYLFLSRDPEQLLQLIPELEVFLTVKEIGDKDALALVPEFHQGRSAILGLTCLNGQVPSLRHGLQGIE
jgi:hypothetical protein